MTQTLFVARFQPPLSVDLELIEALGGPGGVVLACHIPVSTERPVVERDLDRLWLDPAFNPLSFWQISRIMSAACEQVFGTAPMMVPFLFPQQYEASASLDPREAALWKESRIVSFLPPTERVVVWDHSAEIIEALEMTGYLDRLEVRHDPHGVPYDVATYLIAASSEESVQRELLGDTLFSLMRGTGLLGLFRARAKRILLVKDIASHLGRRSLAVVDQVQSLATGVEATEAPNDFLPAPLDFAGQAARPQTLDEQVAVRLVEMSHEIARIRGEHLARGAQTEDALRFLWREISEPESLRVYHLANGRYPENWITKFRRYGLTATLGPIPFVDFLGTLDALWQKRVQFDAAPGGDFQCAMGFAEPDVRGFCLKSCEHAKRCPVPVELKRLGK